MNKAESLNPTALLKVKINHKGVDVPDFYAPGGYRLITKYGEEVAFDWYQSRVTTHRDRDGYLNVEFYLTDFDVDYFESNQPLVRPDWSILTTLEIDEIYYEMGYSINEEDEFILPQDTEILEFKVFVKEESGAVAAYAFTDKQLKDYESKVA